MDFQDEGWAVDSSERLSQAEEEIEMAGFSNVWFAVWLRERVVDVHWVNRRIQVVTEIKADRPDRRMVAHAQPYRMREVVETAITQWPGRSVRSWRCWRILNGALRQYLAVVAIRLVNA